MLPVEEINISLYISDELNECDSSPCVNGICVDGENGYTCNCEQGFGGVNCECIFHLFILKKNDLQSKL